MLGRIETAVPRERPRVRPRPLGAEPALTGLHPVREALRARRRALRRLVLLGAPRAEWEELGNLARDAGVPVVEAGSEPRSSAAGPAPWVRLEAGSLPELGLEALLAEVRGREVRLVALDGVEDPQNVGAIARVAEAAGASGLVLTRRHAPPLSDAVSRASAGAIEWLPVTRVPNLSRALRALKEAGVWSIGADPDAPVDLFSAPDAWLRGPSVLVLGSEGEGIRRGVLETLDHRVRIPMLGRVASLNVSAASAVLLYEIRRRSLAP
jgi:23S rRNA (guanosine2251-2'-O)-methyltransferase